MSYMPMLELPMRANARVVLVCEAIIKLQTCDLIIVHRHSGYHSTFPLLLPLRT